MKRDHLLQELDAHTPLLQGQFGLEREGLRLTPTGRVAQTPHPAVFGSRSYHPYIQTDFSEAQLELITPVASSTSEARRTLGAITDVVGRSLDKEELLWPLSMPPEITDQEIQVAQLENPIEQAYREGLARKYGTKLQAISGIHYNFQLGDSLVQALFDHSGETDLPSFKSGLYLKLAQNFLRYYWFVTYLYGAAPIAEAGFFDQDIPQPVRSLRTSDYGYVNEESVVVSYASLEQYVADIERLVSSGQLSAEKEFYSPVRFRGQKKNRDYLQHGITYIELRCFDINPFDPLGISQDTLDTIHLFLLALLWLESPQDVSLDLKKGHDLNQTIATSHPLSPLPDQAVREAETLLAAMEELIHHFELDTNYTDLVAHCRKQFHDPKLTLSGQLLEHIKQDSLLTFGLEKAQAYKDYAWQAHYALKGYENMELSTQMLLFDVIQQGINFEILDEEDQFLRLKRGNHIEYVKNGNMTSKDNYVTPLAMANKTVTKKILQDAGFPVPAGFEYSSLDGAIRSYSLIAGRPIVVKPKSTNFGLGISIFKEGASREDYQKALEIAFSEDQSVLVEDYIPGTEYRFFVLDGQCEAVLLRKAANVIGDGEHSIRQLIELKNQNPLRGQDHRAPLEKIQLGEIELLMLDQQGYTPDDVLPAGVQADLRRNSNISTGGDSIDVTEEMDASYKELAAQMASAIGAWVCGVDLIIPDPQVPASPEEPHCTCIELNFNPSMYMHTYCAYGPGQSITPKILAKLFPE
ncbi:bifunctional glutamate--cysteine ligase GshA/glutathione synthetase GshB [Streptococcus sp. DD13]|uniref:bifunctional glutamate--cysteine ligase GshA/glutathione synthetase GshB n=1 Tax=Streptococcus sp. DD13 TaxID=1777881 RepID=UPI000793A6F3|nr:bifunctional glutamate--cysteine ligase GshA/glutathione synthetase GshB [Streptococcus sp. DD13]KXT77731.1 Glutathione biosynthesis bifunctional protein gshF [Streptococcus sp. DD13]